MRSVILAALLVLVLSGCSAPDPLETALRCLQAKGVEAEIVDGALVATRYADGTVVPRTELEECIPIELR